MDIKAVIFDMDGVITSSSDQHFSAWKSLASGLGFELPDETERLLKGVSRMDSLEVVLRQGKVQNNFTQEEKKLLAEKKNKLYVEMISKFTPDDLLPGVLELFEACKHADIKIALASVSKNSPLLISRLNIGQYFDYIVDPQDIKNGKPAPDIFLKAAAALGVNTKYCVGIEDAAAGIAAIKSAGMVAVGIGSKDELSRADIIYRDCSEVDLSAVNELLCKKQSFT